MHCLRVGVIGCGASAEWHIRELLTLDEAEIAGLADPDERKSAAARSAHPSLAGIPTFTSAAELYETVALDAVAITTPHTLHYAQTIQALERGLHVLCEKPLACEPEHAREIAARADAAGLTVTVSYQRRLYPPYKYMREVIAAGELGELRAITVTCGQNWELLTRNSWRQDPELSGGGMLMDSGSHLIDVMLWLVDQPVVSVTATVDMLGSPVDTNSAAFVQFAGGARGQLTVIGDLPTTWIENVLVTGTKGVLRYEIEPQNPWESGRVVHYRDGGIVQPLDLPTEPSTDAAWLAAIQGRRPNPTPPAGAVRVAELTAAIYQAAAPAPTSEPAATQASG